MMRKRGATMVVALLLGTVPAAVAQGQAACDAPLPQGGEPVTLDPADFVSVIDNPSWPMSPGSRWVYRETSDGGGDQKVLVRVKERTRDVAGITATVVHDRVTEDGELVEDTFDWYAQDLCGNVWYLGENTKEYEDGHVVSTAGSWEHGVGGALAGVLVPGDPEPGLTYRQEYLDGEAEDAGSVLSLEEQIQVDAGHFRPVMMTKDTTPLEPRLLEYKFYAPGVGPVLALAVSGGSDREELVSYELA